MPNNSYIVKNTLDPLGDLVRDLNETLTKLPHDDVLLPSKHQKVYELKPSNFIEVLTTDTPNKIAFIDGGNGTIAKSPNFTISLNRIYYSVFQGKKRVYTMPDFRVEFLSCIRQKIKSTSEQSRITHDVTLLPSKNSHKSYIPDVNDIVAGISNVTADDPRIYTLPRSLGEWRLALTALDALSSGDIIVMDGSLTTFNKIEAKYANLLFEKAQIKDVTVCAISKTTHLLTRSGEPLLNRVNDISRQTTYGRWRINVVSGVSPHDPGFVMAIKLHPNAQFPFRFEILQTQHEQMSNTRINSILASLAVNSEDMSFLGYPYGLIDADRFAQVRRDEIKLHAGLLESKMRTLHLSKIMQQIRGFQAHDRLNEVTS